MEREKYPIIAVVGPTATGKTAKALELAQAKIASGEFSGVDLISVDSRQVYRGLEILTGADVPEGFERKLLVDNVWAKNGSLAAVRTRSSTTRSDNRSSLEKYFSNIDDSIRLFGVSIIQPGDEWSVAHFQQYARAIIKHSWSNHRLPILVGGTGLYHQELFQQDPQVHVPPNYFVRQKAEQMSVLELQQWLYKLDSLRFQKMNHSDQHNPRRLIRAIELSLAKRRNEVNHKDKNETLTDVDWSSINPEIIMVSDTLDSIQKKIQLRVQERFNSGAVEEVKWLLSLNLNPSLPVLSTLGVSEIASYLSGVISAKECQQLWSLHEFQYAKRQLMWWKT